MDLISRRPRIWTLLWLALTLSLSGALISPPAEARPKGKKSAQKKSRRSKKASRKATVRKSAPRKAAPRKAAPRKTAVRKSAPRKAAPRRTITRSRPARRAPARITPRRAQPKPRRRAVRLPQAASRARAPQPTQGRAQAQTPIRKPAERGRAAQPRRKPVTRRASPRGRGARVITPPPTSGGAVWWTGAKERASEQQWQESGARIREIIVERQGAPQMTPSGGAVEWVEVAPVSAPERQAEYGPSGAAIMRTDGPALTEDPSALADSGLTPPPVAMPGPVLPPSGQLVEAGPEVQPWRLEVEGSMTWWRYDPISAHGDDPVFDQVTTEEIYDIKAIDMMRIAGDLETPWFRLALAYETDRGFGVVDPSLLVDLALVVSGLEDVTFKLTTLDFNSGTVRLVSREDGSTLQRADFSVQMTTAELRYRILDALFIYGRFTDYALPRNVYLRENMGTSEDPWYHYYQISDQLLRVDTEVGSVGLGGEGRVGDPSATQLIFGGYFGVGLGPYRLTTLYSEDRLDDGWLAEVRFGAELAIERHLLGPLSAGLRGTASLFLLSPLGLPDGVEEDLESEGIDTGGFSLSFGTVELLSQGQIYLSVRL